MSAFDALSFDPLNMTIEQSREFDRQTVDLLMQDTPESSKQAAISMTNYIRPTNREASFVSKILTPGGWDESEMTYDRQTDQPQILIDIEPDSAGAQAVDFNSVPETFYPYGKRVPMGMTQVETQRVTKNVIELGGYKYSFRTVLTDLLSLKLAFFRDQRFLNASNQCLASVGTNLTYTGRPNQTNAGAAWSWDLFQKAANVMPWQPNSIEPATTLFSHIMLRLMRASIATEFKGSQVAVDMFRTGISELSMEGDNMKFISTNKKTLVPPGKYYFYGPENQLGRYVQMIEPTMLVENRGTKVSFSIYEVLGMLLVNQAAVSATNFTVS